MSTISTCKNCGGNIVEPSYPGDGAYPVQPMCNCRGRQDCEPEDWGTCRYCSAPLTTPRASRYGCCEDGCK